MHILRLTQESVRCCYTAQRRQYTLGNGVMYNVVKIVQTHPTLAIPELMRILLDDEDLPWDVAWKIVTETFFFTNHTVLPVGYLTS